MKVLILSCNTGEGHNSAARAIKNHLMTHNIECTVVDTLALVGKTFSDNISRFYIYSTKNNLFKHLYNLGASVSSMLENIKSPIYALNRTYSERLGYYIEDNGFDAVICVHLFPAEAITALRLDDRCRIPTIFVMTDYTCIPFLEETELDHYIIPHEHLIEEFADSGIPRGKILPYGIPVDDVFHWNWSKEAAREKLCQTFSWDAPGWHNWFLVMTGSMGFGNTQGIIDETIRQSADGTEVFVVCGRNEEMRKDLEYENRYLHTIHPIGYTDQIPMLMDACDVVFTKPGGISSTEAMSKHIPIIHTEPIPGLETRNAEFFHYHGMSYNCSDPQQQVETALRLCEDQAYHDRMTGAQKMNAQPDTCRKIEELLRSSLEKSFKGSVQSGGAA